MGRTFESCRGHFNFRLRILDFELYNYDLLESAIASWRFKFFAAAIVQLVRTPDCGSGGRGFEPH